MMVYARKNLHQKLSKSREKEKKTCGWASGTQAFFGPMDGERRIIWHHMATWIASSSPWKQVLSGFLPRFIPTSRIQKHPQCNVVNPKANHSRYDKKWWLYINHRKWYTKCRFIRRLVTSCHIHNGFTWTINSICTAPYLKQPKTLQALIWHSGIQIAFLLNLRNSFQNSRTLQVDFLQRYFHW